MNEWMHLLFYACCSMLHSYQSMDVWAFFTCSSRWRKLSDYDHDTTIHKRVAPRRRTPLDDSVSTDDDESDLATKTKTSPIWPLCIWVQTGIVLERESSIMPRHTHSCDLELLTHTHTCNSMCGHLTSDMWCLMSLWWFCCTIDLLLLELSLYTDVFVYKPSNAPCFFLNITSATHHHQV
jgi:hypothetical protein